MADQNWDSFTAVSTNIFKVAASENKLTYASVYYFIIHRGEISVLAQLSTEAKYY